MNKTKKVLLYLCMMFLCSILCMPDVFASAIKINGGATDIYSSGGEGSATYNSDTKTLTLDNYNNEYILLEGFDGETLNVILKGNNTIKSPSGYVSGTFDIALGYAEGDEDNEVTLNITGEEGSKLTIDGYYDGIYIYKGTLNISNVDLEVTDVNYSSIYNRYGDLIYIKDSKIKVTGSKHSISTESHDIKLENVDYTSEDVSYDDFYTNGLVEFKNSKFDITDSDQFLYAPTLTIDNSIINMHSGIYFLASERITINNSQIDANVLALAITVYMNTSDGYYMHVDNSDVTIVTSAGAALSIQTEELIDFDSVVVYQNLDMLETNYLKTKGDVEVIGHIYSYYVTEPPTDRVFTLSEAMDLAAYAGKELHLVANKDKEGNPNTGDNFSAYLITGTLSLIGLVSTIVYLKKKSA